MTLPPAVGLGPLARMDGAKWRGTFAGRTFCRLLLRNQILFVLHLKRLLINLIFTSMFPLSTGLKMKRLMVWSGLLIILTFIGFACKSPHGPDTDSLAFVEIKGKTALEIARTISEVFREAHYAPARPAANHKMMLMFEKEGTTGDMLFYGDWSSKKPWYRVKLNIKSLDAETQLVECDAYRVLEHGDPRFEEERQLSRLKKGHYQDLLNRVKERLSGPPAA